MAVQRRYDALWLTAIVIAGVALRTYRLRWGLPEFAYPDGVMYFVRPAARLVAIGEWIPAHFVHPPGLVYLTAFVFAIWSWASGIAVAPAGGTFYAQLPTLTLLGRVTSVALSAAAIVMLARFARRLIGSRGALLAAAIFALAPLQVLEAHRIQPDAPMLFLVLIAADLAVAGHTRGRRGPLLAAYFIAGFSGGFKYTGLGIATVPAWLTLRWPAGERPARRLAWIAAGGGLALVGLAIGCFPAFFDWQKAWQTGSAVIYYSYVFGMPGVDIKSPGWTYTRYVYGLVVGLPYMMGWPAYLAGVTGFVVLVRRMRHAAGIVLSFVVPFFAIMGGAVAVVARYYLPLAPFLALAAGAALDRGLESPRVGHRVGGVVIGAVLAYTLALTVSQCERLGLGPQRAVVRVVAAQERMLDAGDRKVNVAYPHILTFYYDALRPLLEAVPRVHEVFYPPQYQQVRTEKPELPPDDVAVAAERRWVRDNDVAVVVLPSWVEHAVLRERPDGGTARFFRHLADGALGFRLAGDFRTRFLTQSLYTWGDPMLDTHWETGITGYKVFVRSDAPQIRDGPDGGRG